jgi:hypothetical protein
MGNNVPCHCGTHRKPRYANRSTTGTFRLEWHRLGLRVRISNPHGTTRLALSLRAVNGFWQTTLIREPVRFGLTQPPETVEEFRAAAEPVLQLLQVLLDGTLDAS